MDPKLLDHYRAAPRDPVFLSRPVSSPTPKPFWPLVVYAALLGFFAVGIVAVLINHL